MTLHKELSVRIFDGFFDRALNENVWQGLLANSPTNTVFQTPEWQQAWWGVFGRGRLLPVGIFQNEALVGFAPLFLDGGMIFFVGSGGSDYLDFIGTFGNVEVMASMLSTVYHTVPGCLGFRFYHVPDASPTGELLHAAAQRLGWDCYDEGELAAPTAKFDQNSVELVRKKSLLRHQRYFEREGTLEVKRLRLSTDIIPRLDAFFDQHMERWSDTPNPSLFTNQKQKDFYRQLAELNPSWLRFTEIDWNGRPIAFHFGFSYRGSYLWYKPTFAIDLARRSPGEVLIRQLLLEALEENVEEFDLGLGDETFKQRFANQVRMVHNWGVYPNE
jgi:CelD/BcsL family acetyltransferase involved in cellulose biosynthesis